jgi:hypothetical protein
MIEEGIQTGSIGREDHVQIAAAVVDGEGLRLMCLLMWVMQASFTSLSAALRGVSSVADVMSQNRHRRETDARIFILARSFFLLFR